MPTVKRVAPGSVADKGGVRPGDRLLAINGAQVRDVFDYLYLLEGAEEALCDGAPCAPHAPCSPHAPCAPREGSAELLFERRGGEAWVLHVGGGGGDSGVGGEGDSEGDSEGGGGCYSEGGGDGDALGLVFENSLMDRQRPCANRCVFCFIDQLPKGMRGPLYFKDDDLRLSFLHGNYVTLTNAAPEDLDRIARYRMSPVNVSVHATDPGLRAAMLRPRANRSADIMPALRALTSRGIDVNAQVVLCRGINDGDALDRTLADLGSLGGRLASVSVVPVGLTRFRENLPYLEQFGSDSALTTIRQVRSWQRRFRRERGSRVVYAADELYLLAGLRMPGEAHYEGFPQLENGVGMCALFMGEFRRELRRLRAQAARQPLEACPDPAAGHATAYALTGTAAHGMIAGCAEALNGLIASAPNAGALPRVQAVAAKNHFFGESVTTSGLLTGQDVLSCAKELPLCENDTILLPKTMFRHGSELFLDGMTLKTLRGELKADIIAIENNGGAFARAATRLWRGAAARQRGE